MRSSDYFVNFTDEELRVEIKARIEGHAPRPLGRKKLLELLDVIFSRSRLDGDGGKG